MRFAPLIRVSTEKQAHKGESLSTQKKQIIQYVKALDGTIPDDCMKYSGQEHATVGEERKNLDRLLHDASKDKFDAVIVCDVSRWSRDNLKSKQGLQILKDNGIKFYVGTTEYDLYDPQAILFLGMSTEMNEYFSMEQSRKSLLNKIERFKKGIPSIGLLSWGRTYDRKTNIWGIDKEKHHIIKTIAKRYLNGTGKIDDMAKTYGFSPETIRRTLNLCCGDTWTARFKSKRLNIDETLTMEIPRLLPDEIIEAIKKKAASNRANASYSKHDYLLSKKVYCEQCGVSFYAHSPNGYKYYRHPKTDKCTNLGSVDARELEPAVLLNLFNMYGDEEYLKKAMERAIPNKKKIAKLRKERESLDKKHKRIESKIDNVVEAIAVGVISKDHVRKKMKGYQEQLDLIDERIEHIDLELENTPTEDQIDKDAKLLYEIHREIANLPERLHKMSFDDKRKIVENSFTGKDHRGRRLGVYVKKDDSKKDIIFIIRGAWDGFEIEEQLPLAKEEYEDLLCWPTNRSYDVDEEIKNFKSNLNSRFG